MFEMLRIRFATASAVADAGLPKFAQDVFIDGIMTWPNLSEPIAGWKVGALNSSHAVVAYTCAMMMHTRILMEKSSADDSPTMQLFLAEQTLNTKRVGVSALINGGVLIDEAPGIFDDMAETYARKEGRDG